MLIQIIIRYVNLIQEPATQFSHTFSHGNFSLKRFDDINIIRQFKFYIQTQTQQFIYMNSHTI